MLIAIFGAFPIFGTRSMSVEFLFKNSHKSASNLISNYFPFLAANPINKLIVKKVDTFYSMIKIYTKFRPHEQILKTSL